MIEFADTLYWIVVPVLGLALVLEIAGRVLDRRIDSLSTSLVSVALVLLTASIGLRWIEVGHGPYLATYEAASSYAWVLLAAFLALRARYGEVRNAAPLAIAPALLLLGLGVTSDGGQQFASPAMNTIWLWIHVGFAKMSLALLVLGGGIALRGAGGLQLRQLTFATANGGTSHSQDLDDRLYPLSTRLISAGYFLLAIVIGSGALWARTAWGAYWTWDPIESWALATWLMYGTTIHAQRMWDVSAKTWARINVLTLVLSALLFIGLRFLSLSPHWIYSG